MILSCGLCLLDTGRISQISVCSPYTKLPNLYLSVRYRLRGKKKAPGKQCIFTGVIDAYALAGLYLGRVDLHALFNP